MEVNLMPGVPDRSRRKSAWAIVAGLIFSVSACGAEVTGETPASSSNLKPKPVPWAAFIPDEEKSGSKNERNYSIFQRRFIKSADETDPTNWRAFDPNKYGNRHKLVPSVDDSQVKIGPLRYPEDDMAISQDPKHTGAVFLGEKPKVIFAHQGTPTIEGWLAPKAGYGYQIGETIIFGTTDYTPINYNGKMNKVVDTARVPVQMQSASGATIPTDLSRMFFNADKRLTSQPHRKVYPSLIYLKPDEKVVIDGNTPVQCPPPGQPQTLTVVADTGENQDIRVVCMPAEALVPGTITP